MSTNETSNRKLILLEHRISGGNPRFMDYRHSQQGTAGYMYANQYAQAMKWVSNNVQPANFVEIVPLLEYDIYYVTVIYWGEELLTK